KTKKNLIVTALIGFLHFLYFVGIGLFDWTSIMVQDYRIGALFYNLRTPLRTIIVTIITRIRDVQTQTIITIIIMLILCMAKKWRTGIWYGLTVLLGAALLNNAIKNFYQ